jgi:hypothetical protein
MQPTDRVALLLFAADVANRTIMVDYPKSFDVCRQAIQKCKEWLNTEDITPEALAEYIDADETTNPWMQESVFRSDPDGLNALVFITMVVGHVAHYAYLRAGKAERMSETIAEADENILGPMVDYGKKYGLHELVQHGF